ncbi:MAG: serine/threonine-protein kinase [Cyanobacteria bacterium P01_H01_bin.150]
MVWASGHHLQNGKYVIEQVLGQGGFGITYKARHLILNSLVVIKTPNVNLRNDPEYASYIKRFISEGQRLEKLSETQHPNIVRIRDLFHDGGTYCLVMDFVQGDSLFNLVQGKGALSTEEALQYITQIGDALKIVHQAGLVHRDAHPGNIMVQQDGKAVLIDFGIAGETVPKTISSRFFGNPGFAPCEQMRGDRKPYVDVYSLAASLYYALTGKRPTESFNRKAYNEPLVPPQEHIYSISNELNQAILKGMELEPENRPQTMQEWLSMLVEEQVTIWTKGYQLKNGKYIIEKDIAQGGFGITYLARDENNQRIVIKTLNETVQKRPDFVKLQQDFLNEAVKLAKCNHPHTVKVSEVFQEGKLWCMAMEYIEGEHLADKVVNHGVLSEAEAVGYIQQIGSALTVVHNNGLLHRDVKPANIIVRSSKPEAVLIDFGIAREFIPSETKLHTPYLSHCFAPIEQYQTVAKRGAYTDVYALAATLYFLVTERLPEPAITRASGMALKEPIKINLSTSSRVNKAILKGMELEPENRPQTMQEWLNLLLAPAPPKLSTSNSSPALKAPKLKSSSSPKSSKSNSSSSSKSSKLNSSSSSKPFPDDLSSDRNVDYRKLRDLLRDGKWKEADNETLKVMLKAANREKQGWLDIESIRYFPHKDLRTIDQLWVKYSEGKFGFSVQKSVWESVGGRIYNELEIIDEFASRVGWYIDEFSLLGGYKSKFKFLINKVAKGHLPSYHKPGICVSNYSKIRNFSTCLAFTTLCLPFALQFIANGLYMLFKISDLRDYLLNISNFLLGDTIGFYYVLTMGLLFLLSTIFIKLPYKEVAKVYAALFARPDL